jgi:hypothetical protein
MVLNGMGDLGETRKTHCRANKVGIHPAKIHKRLKTLLEVTNTNLVDMKTRSDGTRLQRLVAIATVFFSEFLLTCPFLNGTARTARMLLSFLLSRELMVPFTLFNYKGFIMKQNKLIPPSMLAMHVLCEIERTASDALYRSME